MKFYLTCLLFLTLIYPQEKPNFIDKSIKPLSFTICVENVEQSANWYMEHLGLKIEKQQNYTDTNTKLVFLEHKNFALELIEKPGAVKESEVKLPAGMQMVNGYSKFSFVVDNLNGFYNFLKLKDVSFFREITNGEFFQGQYFIINDPDGNYIQFFSRANRNVEIKDMQMLPFLAGKMVASLDAEIEWYKNKLGFELSEILDFSEQGVRVGFIELNGFYFELIETGVSINKSQAILPEGKSDLLGITQITFSSQNLDSLFNFVSNTDAKIFEIKPEKTQQEERHFLIEDLTESLIGF